MSEVKKSEAGKYVAIGAGIGLVVGALVAVLVTPKKGKEVRAVIANKIRSIKSKIKQNKVDQVHTK